MKQNAISRLPDIITLHNWNFHLFYIVRPLRFLSSIDWIDFMFEMKLENSFLVVVYMKSLRDGDMVIILRVFSKAISEVISDLNIFDDEKSIEEILRW